MHPLDTSFVFIHVRKAWNVSGMRGKIRATWNRWSGYKDEAIFLTRIKNRRGELISSGSGKVVTKAGWKIIESREDSFWSRNENSWWCTRDIALDRARSLRGLFFANWTEPSLKLIFRGEYERASICLRTRDGIKGGRVDAVSFAINLRFKQSLSLYTYIYE